MMRVLRAADDVSLIRGIRIPMRDGTRLAADLYVADGAGDTSPGDERVDEAGDVGILPRIAWPIVMDYIPYRKDDVDPRAMRHYLELPRRGYAVLRVDIRGTGGSEGSAIDEYVEQEQLDGYDAVEWVAAQPWCDGHVNLMGISYGGFTALQVAALQPPHLTSIIPVDFTDDRYTDDCHYRGGLVRQYYDLTWYGTRMIAWNGMPPDVEGDGSALADGTSATGTSVAGAGAEGWAERLDAEPYLLAWLRNQVDGPYWRQGSVGRDAGRIVCPAFLIGGWRDGYPNPPLRLFERLGGPRRLLIGPWDHRYPDAAIPGPRIDHLDEVVRWLDHWCRGLDDGLLSEPPIVVYMQEAGSVARERLETPGRWRAETDWPPAGRSELALALGAASLSPAADRPSGGVAGGDPSGRGPSGGDPTGSPDRCEYDPTVGTTGGLWSGGVPFGLPTDQRPDEARSLTYTTAPLEDPLSILGRARLVLFVGSTARVIGVAASLADVAPDGTSTLVAKGMLNLTRRRSLTEPEPFVPGEVAELEIEIDATGWRFAAGHRIRLSLAAADWPNVWPTPEPGTLEVWRSPDHPSRLILPVVPDDGPVPAPVFAPSPVVVRPFTESEPAPTWSIDRDAETGRTTVRIEQATEHVSADGTRIARRSGGEFTVAPGDPANVVARGWHEAHRSAPGSAVDARADVTIASNAAVFDVRIDLIVSLDGAPPVERHWIESIPRQLL